MSTPLAPRRSTRTPARPEQFAEQQAEYALHEREDALLRRVQQLSLQPEVPHSSDEEAVADDEGSTSEEEEEEEEENVDPNSRWVKHTRTVTLPPFTRLPGSNLPRQRVRTELGYLQFFLLFIGRPFS
jgi:hypothetical protein